MLVGNGGDELIFDMLLAWGGPGRKLLDMPPTFTMYGIDAQVTGTEVVRRAAAGGLLGRSGGGARRVGRGRIDIIVIANPNNPTGGLTDESFLIELLHATDALVMVDEAYFEFSRHTMRPHMTRCENLVILRTFSKAFSLAGLRVGYLLGAPGRRHRVHEGAPAVLGRLVLASGWPGSVFRERMVFEQGIRDIMRGRDQLIHGLSMLPEVNVVPERGELRARSASSTARRCGATCCTTTRCWCATSRVHRGLRTACASRWAPRRRTAGSSRRWRTAWRIAGRATSSPRASGSRRHEEGDAAWRRSATITRETRETQITVTLDLDGSGTTDGRDRRAVLRPHARRLRAPRAVRPDRGGQGRPRSRRAPHRRGRRHRARPGACARRSADKSGITRFGSAALPMDEALVLAAVDISGRGALYYEVTLPIEIIGTFDTTLAKEFLARSPPTRASRCTCARSRARTRTTSSRPRSRRSLVRSQQRSRSTRG